MGDDDRKPPESRRPDLAGAGYGEASGATEGTSAGEQPVGVDDDTADSTLIEWMLDRTPQERLAVLQGFVNSVWELRRGAKA
jgi:hypothetical protein